MIDLAPTTRTVAELVAGVGGDQLDAPTPCAATSVGDLLDHVDSLALAFTAAARKTSLGASGPPPKPDAARLGTDWRERISGRLDDLAAAWKDGSAWEGMTEAGGLQLPGEVAGVIALNEVLVHGWDIAVAIGAPYACEPAQVEAAYGFVGETARHNPDGTPALFGPPVPVPDAAPLFERLLGLTGRDPSWKPA